MELLTTSKVANCSNMTSDNIRYSERDRPYSRPPRRAGNGEYMRLFSKNTWSGFSSSGRPRRWPATRTTTCVEAVVAP